MTIHLRPLLALLLAATLSACSSDAAPADDPGPAEGAAASGRLGDGFVVWESNRSGDWRIWTKRLDGGGLTQLSPDEPGRQHCCAHVAPDGSGVVYLSRQVPSDRYPEVEVAGPLRLIPLAEDGPGSERVLVPAARTYGWGNRAVVWRSPGELIYVDGEGRTQLLDVASGASTPLVTEPRSELGWLLNAPLTHATHAAPVFAPYDRQRRAVVSRPELGGCEPYFSHDGRFGVFMPAGGGPIRRIDLATREVATLLPKNDPRLSGQGYLYFPMPSRDGRLLAFGASRGEHHHFSADYDVFVAPTDPETLELLEAPVKITDHPATDRYPDVWLAPLPLGRHVGEVPFTVRFPGQAPEGTAEWIYGDGGREVVASGRHTYERPGVYQVTARWQGKTFRGHVVAEPPAPPQVVQTVLRAAGRRVVVHFDEPVDPAGAKAKLASGIEIASIGGTEDGRGVVVELARPVTAADRLELSGVTDRADTPHPMAPAVLPIEPPAWPATRAGLAFLWQDAAAENRIDDPELEIDRAFSVEPKGRARLDEQGRMVLTGGWFETPAEAGRQVVEAARESFELTLVATVTPGPTETREFVPIVDLSGGRGTNLALGQDGRHLVARVRTASTGPQADRPQVRLFEAEPGRPVHVAVTYQPGELVAFRDGQPMAESREVQGGLAPWKPAGLSFGAAGGGFSGVLEGVALYGRALTAAEVGEDYLRYQAVREERRERSAAPRLVARATLTASSEPPTLVEISPYREALIVHEYRLERIVSGGYKADPERIRVAHWAILDGEDQPAARFRPGREATLELTPLAGNPQLESVFVKDTLEPAWELPVYYDAGGPESAASRSTSGASATPGGGSIRRR